MSAMRWLIVSLVLVVSACGSKDSKPEAKPAAETAKPAVAATASQSEAKWIAYAHEHVQWPANKVPERDLAADSSGCVKSTPPGLEGMQEFGHYIKCLQALGWEAKSAH